MMMMMMMMMMYFVENYFSKYGKRYMYTVCECNILMKQLCM